MKIDIVIPWNNPNCIYRQRNFKYIYNHYSSLGDIFIGSGESPFNRAAARNNGVMQARNENLLVVDSDCFIDINSINKGLELFKNFSAIRPFTSIHYLSEDTTNSLINNNDYKITYDTKYLNPNQINVRMSGGAYLIKKSLWMDLGGMNELYEDWGLEDSDFNIRVEYSVGRFKHINGKLLHLYHPQNRIHSKKNIELFNSRKN